ncbi:MAG: ABC transporter permease [Kibdelosporangium sp.]
MTAPVRNRQLPAAPPADLLAGPVLAWLSALRAAMVVQARTTSWMKLVLPGMVQPAVFVIITLGPAVTDLDPRTAILGSAMAALWSVTLWQSGMVLRRESWQGTLAGMGSRPPGILPVLIGKGVVAATISAAAIAAAVVAAMAVTGHRFEIADPGTFAVAVLLCLVTAFPLGHLVACLFMLTKAALRVAEVLVFPVFLIGGMLIPLTDLPAWVRPLSALLSLRWSHELMTDATFGRPTQAVAWVGLVLTCAGYCAASAIAYRRVLARAHRDGTLDLIG